MNRSNRARRGLQGQSLNQLDRFGWQATRLAFIETSGGCLLYQALRTVLGESCWVRATCAWITPSSSAGRMITKRSSACVRCASDRAVRSTDGFAMTRILSDGTGKQPSPPSIPHHSNNCTDSTPRKEGRSDPFGAHMPPSLGQAQGQSLRRDGW
jgi:hypothetical protein